MSGYVEIERDVQVEVVDLETMREASWVMGTRTTTELPHFTDEELEGEAYEGLMQLFEPWREAGSAK